MKIKSKKEKFTILIYISSSPASLRVDWIFLTSNHMLSPTFSSYELCLFLSNYFFIASFVIFINLFASFQLLYSYSKKSFSSNNSIFTIRFSSYGYLSKLSSNSVCFITTCFLLLYWNFTTDNYSV